MFYLIKYASRLYSQNLPLFASLGLLCIVVSGSNNYAIAWLVRGGFDNQSFHSNFMIVLLAFVVGSLVWPLALSINIYFVDDIANKALLKPFGMLSAERPVLPRYRRLLRIWSTTTLAVYTTAFLMLCPPLGLWCGVRLVFSPFIAGIGYGGPIQSMRESFLLTKGIQWKLLLAGLSAAVVSASVLLATESACTCRINMAPGFRLNDRGSFAGTMLIALSACVFQQITLLLCALIYIRRSKAKQDSLDNLAGAR